jgi:hypothetical protein
MNSPVETGVHELHDERPLDDRLNRSRLDTNPFVTRGYTTPGRRSIVLWCRVCGRDGPVAQAVVAQLVASVPGLRGTLNAIAHDPVWIVGAVALELASDVSFVVLFRLFFDGLARPEARLLAWTEQGSGALLPGGSAGGFAVGAWLIRLTGAPMR